MFVEETEIQIHKMDSPDAVLFLVKSNSLTGQGLADEDMVLAAEVDAAAGLNNSHQVVMTIDGFGQLLGIAL